MMNKLKQTGIGLILALALLILANTANAQDYDCKKHGCVRKGGLMLIPETQQWEEPRKFIITGSRKYILQDSEDRRPVFTTYGVPRIGQIVELNIDFPFMNFDELTSLRYYFPANCEGYGLINGLTHDDQRIMQYVTIAPGDNILSTGAKIKIRDYLKYEHDGNRGECLFALIGVLDDGPNREYQQLTKE